MAAVRIVFYLALLLAIGLAGASALLGYMHGRAAIEVVKPVRGAAVQAVYATGTVEPGVMVPIAPRGTARLMALFADEGDTVEKGQVLAQFENTDLQNRLIELQAREALAVKELERKNALRGKGFASEEIVDQAVAELDSLRAQIARTQAELAFLQLLAPENGLVIRRDGEQGEVVAAMQPVFWMSCCEALRVSADVDEEDIPLVRKGQDVLIRADAFPNEVFKGKVETITPKGDPVARSYRVRISLPEQNPLMIGMTAEANIILREKEDALLVPASASVDGALFVVEDGNIVRVPVETGIRSFDAVEITGGIGEDALVVRSPDENIAEGQAADAVLKPWKPE